MLYGRCPVVRLMNRYSLSAEQTKELAELLNLWLKAEDGIAFIKFPISDSRRSHAFDMDILEGQAQSIVNHTVKSGFSPCCVLEDAVRLSKVYANLFVINPEKAALVTEAILGSEACRIPISGARELFGLDVDRELVTYGGFYMVDDCVCVSHHNPFILEDDLLKSYTHRLSEGVDLHRLAQETVIPDAILAPCLIARIDESKILRLTRTSVKETPVQKYLRDCNGLLRSL